MIKVLLIAMACGVVALTATIGENENRLFFRKDYTMLNDLNAFYKFHRAKLNFSDAVATCTAEGAQLFTPVSGQESEAVYNYVNKTDVHFLWLGIHDLFGEGTFVTLTGQPIDDLYSNWGPGEPNNVNNDENCAILNRDTTFNDIGCNSKFNFVCKRSTYNLSQNVPCETYDTAYFFNTVLDECYKFHSTPMKWREAFRICRAEESQLAIINSELEARLFIDEFAKRPDKSLSGNFDKSLIHVGFNDLINQGVYLTIEGKPLSETGYEKWANGQPDNYQGAEHCGSMFRDGLLNDANCETRAMFVCEKKLSTTRALSAMPFSVAGAVVRLPDA